MVMIHRLTTTLQRFSNISFVRRTCVVKFGTSLTILHVFGDHIPNCSNALCVWKININPAIVDVGFTSPYHHINLFPFGVQALRLDYITIYN